MLTFDDLIADLVTRIHVTGHLRVASGRADTPEGPSLNWWELVVTSGLASPKKERAIRITFLGDELPIDASLRYEPKQGGSSQITVAADGTFTIFTRPTNVQGFVNWLSRSPWFVS